MKVTSRESYKNRFILGHEQTYEKCHRVLVMEYLTFSSYHKKLGRVYSPPILPSSPDCIEMVNLY